MATVGFHIYQDKKGLWRWRFKSANGKIMADSGEGYHSKGNAQRALNRFRDILLMVGDSAWRPGQHR